MEKRIRYKHISTSCKILYYTQGKHTHTQPTPTIIMLALSISSMYFPTKTTTTLELFPSKFYDPVFAFYDYFLRLLQIFHLTQTGQ